jgi:hypothetical protein
MPPRKRRKKLPNEWSSRPGKESRVPKKRKIDMAIFGPFSDLFNGEEHEIVPEEDLTKVTWVVRDNEWVVVHGTTDDVVEGGRYNFVLRDLTESEVLSYSLENGWAALAVQCRAIAKLFDCENHPDFRCEQIQRMKNGKKAGSKYYVKFPFHLGL